MSSKRTRNSHGATASIDWAALRGRLESLRTALEKGEQPPREDARRILQERARTFARPPAAPFSVDLLETLQFELAHETYAIETSYVREVHRLREFTPLPGSPSFIVGLANIRSQLLTVIDLKKLFELPEKGLTDLNKIIIVNRNGLELGILADVIHGIRLLSSDAIQPTLPTLTEIRARFLRGISPERVVVLDMEKLLSSEGLFQREAGSTDPAHENRR